MAADKRVRKRRLEDLLMSVSGTRSHLAACRNKGDAAGVKRCELALEFDYARIRKHCAKHDLELPQGVPSEARPTTRDT